MAWTVIDHEEAGSGGIVSWEKDSIPQTYDHLYLKMGLRSEYSGNYYTQIALKINDISSNVYSRTNVRTANGTPVSESATSQPKFYGGYVTAGLAGSNIFGMCEIWFPNYKSSHFKQFIVNSTSENNNATTWYWYLSKAAGLWQQTAAIDQLEVAEINGSDWGQYSTFTLYGLKGA